MHIATRQEVINGQSVTVKVLPPGIAAGGWTPGLIVSNARLSDAFQPPRFDKEIMKVEKANEVRAVHARTKYPDILKMHKEGHGMMNIVKTLKCGKNTVRRAIEWGKENMRWEK